MMAEVGLLESWKKILPELLRDALPPLAELLKVIVLP